MMFLIPDEMLETITCSQCLKFLSIGPVKVYRNRKFKCGRCVKDNDYGVISKCGLILERGLFKCVNRFDGCKQLLAFDKVAEHEDTCKSTTYECPICVEATNIPTFLMIGHFKEKHRGCFLEKPCFKVDLTTSRQVHLYQNGDNLFFVECQITSEDVDLEVFFVGNHQQAESTKVEFIIHRRSNGIDNMDIRNQKCSSYRSIQSMSIASITSILESEFIFVEFQLSCPVIVEFINGQKLKSNSKLAKNHDKRDYLNQWLENYTRRKRKISFGFTMLKFNYNVELKWNSLSLLQTIGKKKNEIVPFCYNCSFPTPLRQNYLEITSNTYQVLCWLCEKYYETKKFDMKFFHSEKLFGTIIYDNFLLYTCVWNCGASFPWHQISNHEIHCPHQQNQQCPVPLCLYRGKLYHFQIHFNRFHHSDELSLYPRIEVGLPNSPCSVMIYVWVTHTFVSLNFRWDRDQYHITIGENSCGWIRPRALFFIDDWMNFLAVATPETPFTWKSEEKLFIKCY
ncbi:uncharacterized protein [Leptinotarsa decemlineata]|uniref:uncharacterized protein n=1 Tax=Leptinotarsa decemlineata TaxID=7539 RepID=UPI003D306F71